MKTMDRFNQFLKSKNGAVTKEMLVLIAAIIDLGFITMRLVEAGHTNAAQSATTSAASQSPAASN